MHGRTNIKTIIFIWVITKVRNFVKRSSRTSSLNCMCNMKVRFMGSICRWFLVLASAVVELGVIWATSVRSDKDVVGLEGVRNRGRSFGRQEEWKEVGAEEFLSRKWKLLKCFRLKYHIDFSNPLRPPGKRKGFANKKYVKQIRRPCAL